MLLILAHLAREFEFALRSKRRTAAKKNIVDRITFWCARVNVDDTTFDQLIDQVRTLPALRAKPAKPKAQCPRCKKSFVNLKAHLARANPCTVVEEVSGDESGDDDAEDTDMDD